MPEMHLKQPGFTYSACSPFTKNKKGIQKFMETGGNRYIYRNGLHKACFQHDMAYIRYKNLTKRTELERVFRDEAFKNANNPKYNGCKRQLPSMVYKIFDKKSAGGGIKSIPNQQLADEFFKPVITKFKRCKVYSLFKDNIWGADLADMQLISK